MFVGHYAAAFALKGKEKDASLGMLFIATQFVDILFFPFAVMGIEHMKFIENYTAVNDFFFEFYPYTHGLLSSLIWAGIFYALYRYVIVKTRPNAKSIATIMALGVLSHWFTDLPVHTADLPLITGEPKFGFGIWDSKFWTFILEAALLIAGLVYYLKKTTAKTNLGKYAAIGFTAFLLLINFLNLYVLPKEKDLVALTASALFFYFLLAGIAFWVDKKRT